MSSRHRSTGSRADPLVAPQIHGESTIMAKSNGSTVPEFMRQVVADEPPASDRVVAEHAVLALNASMMRIYEDSLTKFKQTIRERVPIVLALFSGQGGQM